MPHGEYPDTTEVLMGWSHVPSVSALAARSAARSMIEPSMAEAKAKGWVRMEGKDYVMQDGDAVEFRSNV